MPSEPSRVVVVGYKVVRSDGRSLHRPHVTFTVGGTYELPDGVKPVLHTVGFHFCRTGLDCIKTTGWDKQWRVLRVTVPDDAAVVNDATDYATSKLVVEADVTADVVPQMTGTITWRCRDDTWTCTMTITRGFIHSVDDRPALVRTADDGRRVETWYHKGKPSRKTKRDGRRQPAGVITHRNGSRDEQWLHRGTVGKIAHYARDGTLVRATRWPLVSNYA
jgi:hypothetical protein